MSKAPGPHGRRTPSHSLVEGQLKVLRGLLHQKIEHALADVVPFDALDQIDVAGQLRTFEMCESILGLTVERSTKHSSAYGKRHAITRQLISVLDNTDAYELSRDELAAWQRDELEPLLSRAQLVYDACEAMDKLDAG